VFGLRQASTSRMAMRTSTALHERSDEMRSWFDYFGAPAKRTGLCKQRLSAPPFTHETLLAAIRKLFPNRRNRN
jgi:hypothetical protein